MSPRLPAVKPRDVIRALEPELSVYYCIDQFAASLGISRKDAWTLVYGKTRTKRFQPGTLARIERALRLPGGTLRAFRMVPWSARK